MDLRAFIPYTHPTHHLFVHYLPLHSQIDYRGFQKILWWCAAEPTS
jgi:hypothetical protein